MAPLSITTARMGNPMSAKETPLDAVAQMDPGAFYRDHTAGIDAAVKAVLASGRYLSGPQVHAFEQAFAAHLTLGEAVGVASGTDAVSLALRAVGIEAGDYVVTVSHTAVATVAAIELVGAIPLLVDVDPIRCTMDPRQLELVLAAIPRIRAVVVVHLYGQPADIDAIAAICLAHSVVLIEDCAQAHGALIGETYVGGFGAASAFSFYPTKNLGCFGDGGAVTSKDPAIVQRVRMLKEYGWRQRYVSEYAGINSRLDEVQAAVLNFKLPWLNEGNRKRRAIAALYDAGLAGLPIGLPSAIAGTTPVYHQYVVRHPARDRLAARLAEQGIMTNIHYPVPVHLQPAYRDRIILSPNGLPATEALAAEILSLPMFPELETAAAGRVIDGVRRALTGL